MHFINNHWIKGLGPTFNSLNPATGESIWHGEMAIKSEVDEAMYAARKAFPSWALLSIDKRIQYLKVFNEELKNKREALKTMLSKEVGKPLWEADTEMSAMIGKLEIAIEAYHERTGVRIKSMGDIQSVTHHKPHGVVAVLGPFNFPAHLPNGHVIPALLAGNTVVFKPSELTPMVSQAILECWHKANLPSGVLNLVQGGVDTGILLSQHPDLDGLMFTGSFKTGLILSEEYAKSPQKILALEMGGNNPLVVHKPGHISTAVYHTLMSAFITSGQRCTCARRLIVTNSPENQAYVSALKTAIPKCTIGAYTDTPEPFMGPVISKQAALSVMTAFNSRVKKGANVLVPMIHPDKDSAFLSPGLMDVTDIKYEIEDEEIFGPLLQLVWVENFSQAIQEANRTKYGLVAGLLCDDEQLYEQFYNEVHAGLIHWNRPLTGSSSGAPFGGIGKSGNHRPSAYYAADYCAYPVACLKQNSLSMTAELTPGLPSDLWD